MELTQTQQKIIISATEIFINHGCRSITMDDIASDLGMSKRTLYENFSSKQELLEKCILQMMEENHCRKLKMYDNKSSNILEHFLREVFSQSEMAMKLHLNFYQEVEKYFPEVYEKTFLANKKAMMDENVRDFQKAIDDGLILKDTHPEVTFKIFEHLSLLMMKRNFFPMEFSGMDIFSSVFVTYLRGLSTQKGINIIDKLRMEYELK